MTVRKFVPIYIPMTMGYPVKRLSCEVVLEQNVRRYDIDWKKSNVFRLSSCLIYFLMIAPYGYHKHISKYNWGTIPLTPKGYSTMVLLPSLIEHDSPFRLYEIIETDVSE